MVRKICYSIVAIFLLVSLGKGFGSEVVENTPEQGSTAKVDKVEDEEKESKEEALSWYREHFVLWEACHGELVAKLGENIKRDRAYSQRAIVALEKLLEVLPEEKKQDLGDYIAQYRQIASSLGQGLRKARERKRVKRTLNNLKREIKKKFSYKVVEVRADLIKREKEIIESGKVTRLSGAPPTRGKRYRYVADRNSRTFHRVMCIYVSKIKEENRVYFETKKEARKSSRRLHRGCR